MIIPIDGKRIFTDSDVRDIVPIIQRITDHAVNQLSSMLDESQYLSESDPVYQRILSEKVDLVDSWVDKVSRLGCEAKGLWRLLLPTEKGYYIWQLDDGMPEFCEFKNCDIPEYILDDFAIKPESMR